MKPNQILQTHWGQQLFDKANSDHPGFGGNNCERSHYLKPYRLLEKAPDAPVLLCILKTDPGETTNLYFEHPEIVKELRELLETT